MFFAFLCSISVISPQEEEEMPTDVPKEEEGESDVEGKLGVQIFVVCFREAHEDVNKDNRGGLI